MFMKLNPVVFHQHFTSSFCVNILLLKNYETQTVSTLKICKTLLHEKGTCKMLVKLTPVVNFINILQADFASILFC
jgi:hypothetical protein